LYRQISESQAHNWPQEGNAGPLGLDQVARGAPEGCQAGKSSREPKDQSLRKYLSQVVNTQARAWSRVGVSWGALCSYS
jgi:hypothetical protein